LKCSRHFPKPGAAKPNSRAGLARRKKRSSRMSWNDSGPSANPGNPRNCKTRKTDAPTLSHESSDFYPARAAIRRAVQARLAHGLRPAYTNA
jgi:hypothetical protein